jgi:RHS repeat-associated protein
MRWKSPHRLGGGNSSPTKIKSPKLVRPDYLPNQEVAVGARVRVSFGRKKVIGIVLAHKDKTQVQQKRYRYTGKERDDSSGLSYYGARYLAAEGLGFVVQL